MTLFFTTLQTAATNTPNGISMLVAAEPQIPMGRFRYGDFYFLPPFFMATRSFIARNIESLFEGVYCHYDGYPEYNGVILQEHYQDSWKLASLLSFGDISTLGPEIGQQHDFDARTPDVTTFYGRDRGESNVDRKTFGSLDDLVRHAAECGCEFIYLFDSGKWYFLNREAQYFGLNDGKPFGEFQLLSDELAKIKS